MVCVCVCVCVSERRREGGKERDSMCPFCLIFSAEVHKDQFSKLIRQVRERQDDDDDDGCDLGEKESELRHITGRNSDCDNRERLTTQIL